VSKDLEECFVSVDVKSLESHPEFERISKVGAFVFGEGCSSKCVYIAENLIDKGPRVYFSTNDDELIPLVYFLKRGDRFADVKVYEEAELVPRNQRRLWGY